MQTDMKFSRRQIVAETWPLLLAVFLLYIPMTWPLAPRFFTHLPGVAFASDTSISIWNFWWFHERMFEWFPNPYQTNAMFYPLGTPLAYQGTHYFFAVLTAPIAWLFGLIPAINAACLWTFLASAAGFYWLARLLGFPKWACWLGALLFSFSPYRIFRLQQHINFLATDWVAFYALCLMVLLQTKRWAVAGLCAGLCMAGCMYTDLTFPVLLVLITVFYTLYFFRPRSDFPLSRRLFLGLGTAVFVAVLLTLPITLSLRSANEHFNYYIERGNIGLSTDLLRFAVPSSESLLHGFWTRRLTLDLGPEGAGNYFGMLPLALFLVGLVVPAADRRMRFWKWAFLLLFVLSLGPFLKVGGEIDLFHGTWGGWKQPAPKFRLTLPYAFASYIPLVNNARGPVRFHGVTTLPFFLVMLTACTFIVGRFKTERARRIASAGVCIVALLEYAAPPISTYEPEWALMKPLRDDVNDTVVLDGVLNNRAALVHQALHGKNMITGHVGRVPPEVYGYMEATPVLREFTSKESSPDTVRSFVIQPGAPEITRRVVDFLDIGYVIVDHPARDFQMKIFDGVVPNRIVAENERSLVYRLEQHSTPGVWPGGVVVGKGEWSLYLAHGWGQWTRVFEERANRGIIWPASPIASVLFKSDKPRTVSMGFETFLPPSSTNVRMSISVNGRWFRDVDVPIGKHVHRLAFDDTLVRSGLNEVEFRWPYAGDIFRWSDSGYSPTNLYCVCGTEGGRFRTGSLEVNGQWAYTNGHGYNIIEVADNGDGLLRAEHFDTLEDDTAMARMVERIGSIPEQRLVVVMGAMNVFKGLTQEAVDALGTLGASFDLREKQTWSHISIGRKGMPAGTALETYNNDSISVLAPGRCGFSAFQFFAVDKKTPPVVRDSGAEEPASTAN